MAEQINNLSFPKVITIPALMSVLLVLVMYHDVLTKLVQDWWTDPNYSHGFIIPLISIYLIYERKSILKYADIEPCPIGAAVLIAGGLLFLLGHVAGEQFTLRISFIIVIAGLVISFAGLQVWRILWPSVLYLLFMIPLPYILYDSIASPLKLLATKTSTMLLKILDVPIYSEGNLIFLPNTTLEVADACSGIRSLISILALSVFIAILTQRTFLRRLLLVFLSVPVVLVCNMLRIIITGLLAAKEPKLATGFFHSFSGEVIFVGGLAFLFALSFFIRKFGEAKASEKHIDFLQKKKAFLYPKWTLWLAPLLLTVVFFTGMSVPQTQAIPILRSLSDFPERIDGFKKLKDDSFDKEILQNLGVDHYLFRLYQGPDDYPVWLYIGYYEDQKEGAMIHSPKHCYPGAGWHPISSSVKTFQVSGDRYINVNEMVIEKGGNRQLVYYWYQSRGRTIADEYKDRLFMIIDSIVRRRSDGALVRISGPAENLKKARQLQRRLIQELYPILKDYLPS